MSIRPEDWTEQIEQHMGEQPYSIKCAECGDGLDASSSVDSDYDLSVEVTPCQNCINNAIHDSRGE